MNRVRINTDVAIRLFKVEDVEKETIKEIHKEMALHGNNCV